MRRDTGAVLMLAAILGLGGCGRLDPELSVLSPGAAVVAGNADGASLDTPDYVGYILKPGVRVTIGHDPGRQGNAFQDRRRPIQVTVESGPHAGKSGEVARYALRPVR